MKTTKEYCSDKGEFIAMCPFCKEKGIISPLEGERGSEVVHCKKCGELKISFLFNGTPGTIISK